ncbi:MAG: hypothetical protein ACK56I_19155, partial [bacterium]
HTHTHTQAALEANRAHHRRVEKLQYELDEQERTLSDDVRKKMTARTLKVLSLARYMANTPRPLTFQNLYQAVREAVNARERELLAEVQLHHGARQADVDDGPSSQTCSI